MEELRKEVMLLLCFRFEGVIENIPSPNLESPDKLSRALLGGTKSPWKGSQVKYRTLDEEKGIINLWLIF